MRVLVTGGTGDLGHRVVLRLDKAGHDVLVGTRTPRAANHFHHDLDDGRAPALDGIDAVVHLATSPLVPSRDIEGSARLWEAAKEAGVGHVIYVSIVGIDDHPSVYYRAKRAVEAQLEESGLRYTILRATQFHSLIPHFHGLVPRFTEELGRRFGFVPVPTGVEFQPIDPDVVADRVVELVEDGPAGRVDDLGGPEVLAFDDMVAAYMRARGDRRLLLRVPAWGDVVSAYRRGDHLAPHAVGGGATYAEFLAGISRRPHRPGAVWRRFAAAGFFVTTFWTVMLYRRQRRISRGRGNS